MINLYTICKNDVFVNALKQLLLSHNIILSEVCTEPQRAVEMYSHSKADVVFLDFNWSTKDVRGADLFNSLLQHDSSSKVIFTSTNYEPVIAEVAKKSGARGYIYRNIDRIQTIVDCIRQVHGGNTFFAGDKSLAR